MWFIGKSILSYLIKDDVKNKEKEKLISKRKTLIKLEISKLKDEELINYLVHPNLPEEVKELIGENLKQFEAKVKFQSEKERLEKLVELFKNKKQFTTKQLKTTYYPKVFKKIIIDNIYKEDSVNLILSSKIPLNIKLIIIEVRLSKDEALKLLGSNISKDLKDHIVEHSINTPLEISYCIEDKNIPETIKKEVVITKINKANIFKIIRLTCGNSKNIIYELKQQELDEIVESQNSNTILELLSEYDTPEDIINKLFTNKLNIIIEAIKKCSKEKLKHAIRRETNNTIIEYIIEYRKKDLYQILKELLDFELLSFLNLKFLPSDCKNYIIKNHQKTIERRIKSSTETELSLYYTKKDTNLPLETQKQIIDLRKDEFIKKINSYTDKEVLNELKYNHNMEPLTLLIIQLRLTKDMLFELLNESYISEEIINLLIKEKNDIILNLIESEGINNFITNKTKIKMSEYTKNQIVEYNKTYIKDKINALTIDEKYKLLSNYSTLESCKKIILDSLNIKDLDYNVCIELLKIAPANIILENFNKIKDFITSSNINFESFIQYGSGSQKHADWLNIILCIIENDLTEEFITCKKYFFDKYYDEDKEKENKVYLIADYLELITNFDKYQDLCMNLASENKDLSKEDKSNISFLFNIVDLPDVDLPETLEELSTFKTKIYEEYLDKITNKYTPEYEIRKLFNDLLLCNSDTILNYIGGTGALRTIKIDNSNSNTILNLADELIDYSKIIEMVNDTNNIEGLRQVLEYAFKDIETLTRIQNLFSTFEKKVTRLYELDSKNNLTTLEKNKHIEGVLSNELSKKYGGEVYDYSDKNYALYAHVCSHRENIEDLLNGIANGKSNFISVSPISYRGQKYYWNRSEVILAYDKIPNGSFVCSSINNMGSNGNISNNSSEVSPINRVQRGILETSAVTSNNSEALLYREGLIPCGLILPGGREPTEKELEYHQKYNLPFIITQEIEKVIEEPKFILKRAEDKKLKSIPSDELEHIKELLSTNININKEDDEYTGREVALFTDCHSMYEPTLAVLEDIRRHGIEEIYSLGDNVGVGPNPAEVFDLLEEYNVKSIAGNSEYYNILGIEPFPYFSKEKADSQEWTKSKLGPERIKKLKLYPASVDLILGGKKIALCHFINDVRWDFRDRSTHTYQANYENGGARQFLYTNTEACKKKIDNVLSSNKASSPEMKGYQSSKETPLFEGKEITNYDAVIQGHVHFEMDDSIEDTDIYTLRAVGMGYKKDPQDKACYYVLKERKDNTFEIEKRLVKFNRNSLLSNIHTCNIPNKSLLLRFVNP